MSEDKLRDSLEKLAIKLTDKLLEDGEPSKETNDAFKAVTSYFAATRKLNSKAGSGDDEGANFSDFRKRIKAASSGDSDPVGPTGTNGSGKARSEPN